MQKGDAVNTLPRRKDKNDIDEQLIRSLIDSEKVDTSNLNRKADKAEKYEVTAAIIKQYEDIIPFNINNNI